MKVKLKVKIAAIAGLSLAMISTLWAQNNPNCTMYELRLPCIPSSITPTWSDCSVGCRSYWSCTWDPQDQWCVDSYDATREFDHVETTGNNIFGYSCQQYNFPDSNCLTLNSCGNQAAFGAPSTGTCALETCGGSCD
jgi:hypothetical protein